jgi:hypothetical protein
VTDRDLLKAVADAVAELPDRDGGTAIVLAAGGSPPAFALLSSGDVLLRDDVVRLGIHATSSAVARVSESFSLLVPLGVRAARLEVGDVTVARGEHLALVAGRVTEVRPTAEPPWTLEMSFRAEPPDDERIDGYVEYWQGVRSWLAGTGPEPSLPFT